MTVLRLVEMKALGSGVVLTYQQAGTGAEE
jgi:hypothetical protein